MEPLGWPRPANKNDMLMNIQRISHFGFVTLALALNAQCFGAASLGTAFTYQGRLQQSGVAVTGFYDFQFSLWDNSANGTRYGSVLGMTGVGVTNGIFTVGLDFGAVYTGTALWLDIAARSNGVSTYTPLTPRQALTAAPFANYSTLAYGASLATMANSVAPGSITAGSLAPGAVTQLGSPGGTYTNAVQVSSNGWVGIGDSTPSAALEVTGGAPLLGLTVYGSVQDGLGNTTNLLGAQGVAVSGNLVAVASGADNAVTLLDSSSSTLAWRANLLYGQGNFTNLNGAMGVAFGPNNLLAIASTRSSAVTLVDASNPDNPVWRAALVNGVGGWSDLAGATAAAFKTNLLAIASSNANAVTLADVSNPAAPVQKVVIRNGLYGFNYLGMPNAVAFSGNLLAISSWSSNAVTLVNVANPTSPVLLSVITKATYDQVNAPWGVAMDGNLLAIAAYAPDAVVLVDVSNPASPAQRSVLKNNTMGIKNFVSPLGMAFLHRNSRILLAVSARDSDLLAVFDVTDPANPVLRGSFPANTTGLHYLHSPRGLAFNSNSQLVVSAFSSPAAITLVGLPEAQQGILSDTWVGIGTTNARAALDVVGDVLVENANRFEVHATRIEMGTGAIASGAYATALGDGVTAAGAYSTALGYNNTASGDLATVLGYNNTASGRYSTAMGYNTTASGSGSMAAGSYARALNDGSFVWGDSQFGSYFSSTANDQFLIRAAGGVGINKNNPAVDLDVNGNLSAGGVGIGTGAPQDGVLDVEGDTHINDHDLFLRGSADRNHGLGWYGSTKLFGTAGVDGPVLYGFAGGGLGTKGSSGVGLALGWDAAGRVTVDPGNINTGTVSVASLIFGSGSGEGLASRRTSGPGQFALDFYTGFNRRMSIFSDGSVTIGGTNAERTLDVNGDIAARASLIVNAHETQDGAHPEVPGIFFGNYVNTGEYISSQRGTIGSNQYGLDFYTSGGRRLMIANNGNVGISRQPAANRLEVAGDASKDVAGSWLANSDARIKRDIQPVTNAAETLDRVRLVSFKYTDDYRRTHPSVQDRTYLNVLAQEFREVFPDHVKSSGERLPDGSEILQVDTYPLTIYSAAAIQELNRELKAKEAEIRSLKERLDRLEQAVQPAGRAQ